MSKPDHIPADIWQAAVIFVGTSDDVEMHRHWIAQAMLSERERCAKVADDDDGALPRWGEDRNQKVSDITKVDIAAAIRKGAAA
jgi:hypothetical protein